MLKPQKKKLNKKELKKDPLLDSVMKAQTFYESNKNSITYGLAGLIIAILLFVWINALMDENTEKASTLLGKAQMEYENFNTNKAIDFIDKVRSGYSGTDAALQATFLLANIKYSQGNYEDAKLYFKEFLESYSGSEILLSSGYAGLAACLEVEKDYMNAAANYEKASDAAEELAQASEYLYLAGLNYQTGNDNVKAVEMFQKVIEMYPDSPQKFNAQANLVIASAQ